MKKLNWNRIWRKIKIYIIFIIAVFAFAIMGMFQGDSGFSGKGAVAVVNGVNISKIELDRQMSRYDKYLSSMPAAQRQLYLQSFQSRELSSLVSREILFQEANKNGFIVTKKNIIDQIVNMEPFKTNGRFDSTRYFNLLKSNNLNVAQFEKGIKKDIVINKIQQFFSIGLSPSNVEVNLYNKLNNTKLNISFVKFNKEDLAKSITVTSKDISSFLKDEQSLKEANEFYTKNKSDFTSKEEVKARHVLVKFKDGDKKSEDKANKDIKEIHKSINKDNFSKIAKEKSEDGSATNGGSLGYFTKGKMVPAFEKVAFNIPVGSISNPIKTPYGYHIIIVDDKRPAKTKEFKTVKNEIAKKLYSKSISNKILAKLKSSFSNGKLNSLLKKYKLKWVDTGDFKLSEASIPKIGNSDAVMDAVFSLEKIGQTYEGLVESSSNYYVVKLKNKVFKTQKKKSSLEEKGEISNNNSNEAINSLLEKIKDDYKVKKFL